MKNRLHLATLDDLDTAIRFLETFYPHCDFSIRYSNPGPGLLVRPYLEIDISTVDKETGFLSILQHGSISKHFEDYTN